jgi:geranylgeranyl pyrophosphate synthase
VIPSFQMVEPGLDQVKAKIIGLARAESEFVSTLAEYALRTRGQMLRPTLLLASSLLGGAAEPPPGAVSLGAMVELIHGASLLHDDVVDGGRFRRKLVTVNAKWGNKEAVLLGDFVLALALDILSDFPDARVLKSAQRITRTLAMGELVELEHASDVNLTEPQYLEIIGYKTASFFAECCYLGGVMGGLDADALAKLSRAGKAIGMAYQICDDLLDVVGSLSGLGKDITADVLNGNITLPIIRTLSCSGAGADDLKAAIARADAGWVRVHLPELVRASGGAEYAERQAREFAREASQAIEALPATAPRIVRALADFPEYMFARIRTGGDAAAAASLVAHK